MTDSNDVVADAKDAEWYYKHDDIHPAGTVEDAVIVEPDACWTDVEVGALRRDDDWQLWKIHADNGAPRIYIQRL